MRFIRTLVNLWLTPQKDIEKRSLESKQTGSCGGMSTTELKIRIELILEGVDTQKIIAPVTELAALSHTLQTEFLGKLTTVAELSASHAYDLMLVYTPALNMMNSSENDCWIEHIRLALLEKNKEQADALIKDYTGFVSQTDQSTVQLADIKENIEKLVACLPNCGLTIDHLDMTKKKLAYTDGIKLFLPPSINLLESYADNYLLYKAMTFQLIGQIECRSHLAIEQIKAGIANDGADFLNQFAFIETVRINHYLSVEFPGLWKNILVLHRKLGIHCTPDALFSTNVKTSVFDSLAIIEQRHAATSPAVILPYQCDYSPETLSLLHSDHIKKTPAFMSVLEDNIESEAVTDEDMAERISLRHRSGSAEVHTLSQSHSDMWENLNQQWVKKQQHTTQAGQNKKPEKAFFYPEWDVSLNKYRKDWCRVIEVPVLIGERDDQLLSNAKLKFSEYLIKKTLDRIMNSQRSVRYQSDGDEIDLDAWVEASSNKTKYADALQNVYIRNNKSSRRVAMMFAVDISGSTAGWKNEVIQQSTWLLSRTLSHLDDQHAIYAFSGSGRHQCEIHPVKKFNEKYNNTIKQRISSLSAQQYTRMGAAIRHLSKILNQTDAKTKVLFILTDGRPDDLDSYRGQYGIEDTRIAINEAKALQLNPFVLTFDKECLDYLPYMLGKNRYRLITNISMLPLQISNLYKQLTT